MNDKDSADFSDFLLTFHLQSVSGFAFEKRVILSPFSIVTEESRNLDICLVSSFKLYITPMYGQ